MSVRVLFFAQAAGWMGRRELTLPLADALPLSAVLEAEDLAPLRGRRQGVRYAVNRAFADLTDTVRDGDEVAVLPPVSGG